MPACHPLPLRGARLAPTSTALSPALEATLLQPRLRHPSSCDLLFWHHLPPETCTCVPSVSFKPRGLCSERILESDRAHLTPSLVHFIIESDSVTSHRVFTFSANTPSH